MDIPKEKFLDELKFLLINSFQLDDDRIGQANPLTRVRDKVNE